MVFFLIIIKKRKIYNNDTFPCIIIVILPLSFNEYKVIGLDVFKPYECSIKVQLINHSTPLFPYKFEQSPVLLKFNSSTIRKFNQIHDFIFLLWLKMQLYYFVKLLILYFHLSVHFGDRSLISFLSTFSI